MFSKIMPKLKVGEVVADVPIIQGGMSVGISLSGLASAVAEEGGIGVIGAAGIGMLEPDFQRNFRKANIRALRKEIRKAREMTDGIIGVNIMVALSDFEALLQVAIDENVDLVFAGAGLPMGNLKGIGKENLRKVIPIVSSARAARLIFTYWERNFGVIPEGVVVEGPLAGGHLGFKRGNISKKEFALERILPEVIETVEKFKKRLKKYVAVIAAGGIFTGKDILKFLKLGADGVQMATRFVATEECDASPEFKQEYINAKKEDIVIIDSPVGLPGRAIKNRFLQDVADGKKKPFRCPWKCLKTCDIRKSPYCIAKALTSAKVGIMKNGFAFAGANAYRLKKIVSVKELMETIKREFAEAVMSKKAYSYT